MNPSNNSSVESSLSTDSQKKITPMFKITLGIQQNLQNGNYNCLIEGHNISTDELPSALQKMHDALQSTIAGSKADALPSINTYALPVPPGNNTNTWPRAPFLDKAKSAKPAKLPTEKQLECIKNICRTQKLNPEEVAQAYGASDISQMSGQDCWEFIRQHQKK